MLGDQWHPLDCVFCNNRPLNTPIYSCTKGHLICVSCYNVLAHQITDSSSCHLQCKLCNAEVTKTRNVIAEMLIEHSTNPKSNVSIPEILLPVANGSGSESSSSFLADGKDPRRSMMQDTKSLLNVKCISRRPICCPEYSCRRMVAVTSLVSHFQFEHPRVLKVNLSPDVREDFVVSSEVFSESNYYLIGLLLLGDKPHRRHRKSVVQPSSAHPPETRLPITLLGSILQLPIKEYEETTNTTKSLNNKKRTKSTGQVSSAMLSVPIIPSLNTDSFLIFWISSTEMDLLTCTIEVSDLERNTMFRYHGPTSSIRDNQDPRVIFKFGNCLCIQNSIFPKLLNPNLEFMVSVMLHRMHT